MYIQGYQGALGISSAQTALTTKQTINKWITMQAAESLVSQQPNKTVLRDAVQKLNASSKVTINGPKMVNGDIPFYIRPDEGMGLILAMALGNNNDVTGDAGTGYEHTFNPWSCDSGDGFSEFGVTIQKLLGGCDNTLLFDYLGCFCNSLTIEMPETGAVVGTMNILGIDELVANSTYPTPSYSTVSPFEDWMMYMEIGDTIGATSAVGLKSGTLTIDNQIQLTPDRDSSTRLMSGRTLGQRLVNFEFNVTQEDNLTLYNYWKNNDFKAIKIVLEHTDSAGSGGSYKLEFNLPRVTFMGNPPALNSAEAIEVTYSVEAEYDDTEGYDIQAVLLNTQSGVYSV